MHVVNSLICMISIAQKVELEGLCDEQHGMQPRKGKPR